MKARKIIKRTATVFYKDIKKDTFYINKNTLWGSGTNNWYIFKPSKNYSSRIKKNRLIAISIELTYFHENSALPQPHHTFKQCQPDWELLGNENINITKELLGL
jgi:hypothetical protein